jgi:hypothetical protein
MLPRVWCGHPLQLLLPGARAAAPRPPLKGRRSGAGGDTVRVSFALPYRCTFGQHLCLVGSVQRLGSWDVRQGVAMSWSEGDICAPRSCSAWVAFICMQA